MSISVFSDSRLVRLAAIAHAALTTEEAKAFYSEAWELTQDAAAIVAHGFMVALRWAVWACDIALAWAVAEVPRFVADVRSAIVEAVANAQAEPIALPWSAEIPVSNLEAWSNSIEIQWPEPSATAKKWVTGMMPR